MTVEPATFITELDDTLPADSDNANELDDHLRLVKQVLQNTIVGDGAGDDFDHPVTATLLQMNSWLDRINVLEGSPVEVPSPAIGLVQIADGETESVVVTGLGFEPTQIMAWCVTNVFTESEMSFGSWSVTTGDGHAHHWWSNPSVSGSKRFTGFIATNSVDNSGAAGLLDIQSTEPDGFTLFLSQTPNGQNMIWVAFP